MWPTISNIDSGIAEKIKSYPNDLSKASNLTSWIRVFSGAVVDGKPGLIMQSNTNWKLLKAAGEGGSSLYGSVEQSGTLGVDWNGNDVAPLTGGRTLRPSPIITSFNSKEGKDQISRTCDFSITCYSLQQLEYLQSYFMEPGYSVAVEWGWNTVDSMKGLVKTSKDYITKSILDQIADSTLNNENLTKKRKTTLGEYDIFLGFIVGSTVSNDGENFKIDVRLRGEPSLPTYLQSHNGTNQIDETGVIINSRKVNRLYSDTELESLTDVAKRRFAYMFNSLPAFRQTIDIKKLENSVQKEQFINFDKKIEEQVNSGISGGFFRSDSVKIEYKGLSKEIATENLFSTNRYIKMDLAVSILNTIGVIDKYTIGGKEVTFKINIDNTIIGAFPYIFSTKADKLIIPGTIPDFLQYFLQLNTIEQSGGGALGGGFLKVNGQWKAPQKASDGIVSFVNSSDLNQFNLKEKSLFYGYLKDLYVNFDIFKSKIEQKNKNIREIFLDILNEMSSAVNGLWNFQIVEGEFIESEKNSNVPSTNNPFVSFSTIKTFGSEKSNMMTGDIELTVIDENWIGENPNPEQIVEFNHNGTTSPFLNSNLDVSIPADMANMIVLKRMGGTSQPDMKNISVGKYSLFNAETDLFLKKRQPETNNEEGKDNLVDKIAQLQQILANEDDKITTKKSIVTSASLTQSITITEYRDTAGNLIKTDRTVSDINGTETTTTYTDTSIQKTNEELQSEIKNKNETVLASLTAFLDKLDVVPLSIKEKLSEVGNKTFTYTDNLNIDKIKQNFTSYCFDDTEYFNRLKNDAFEKKYENGKPNGLSHPLPIKYSFTILGNSGIRRGDTFNINGIPSKYKDHGLFQVTEIEHTISDMKWTTTVTGQYRQIQ